MRFTACLIIIAALVTFTFALKEAPKILKIGTMGVLKRVSAAQCKIKSKKGDNLFINYTGALFSTRAKFDSNLDREQPFKFTLGAGQVIEGWEKGLTGMCIGEKRKLIIPPALGYGESGAGDVIPGGATLVFEVELLNINFENYADSFKSEEEIDFGDYTDAFKSRETFE